MSAAAILLLCIVGDKETGTSSLGGVAGGTRLRRERHCRCNSRMTVVEGRVAGAFTGERDEAAVQEDAEHGTLTYPVKSRPGRGKPTKWRNSSARDAPLAR